MKYLTTIATPLLMFLICTSFAYSPAVIESRVKGEFKGWEGETVVRLTNGQIWQQTEYYYYYRYAYMPEVLIYNSNNGIVMKVDGIDKAVRVQRLK